MLEIQYPPLSLSLFYTISLSFPFLSLFYTISLSFSLSHTNSLSLFCLSLSLSLFHTQTLSLFLFFSLFLLLCSSLSISLSFFLSFFLSLFIILYPSLTQYFSFLSLSFLNEVLIVYFYLSLSLLFSMHHSQRTFLSYPCFS